MLVYVRASNECACFVRRYVKEREREKTGERKTTILFFLLLSSSFPAASSSFSAAAAARRRRGEAPRPRGRRRRRRGRTEVEGRSARGDGGGGRACDRLRAAPEKKGEGGRRVCACVCGIQAKKSPNSKYSCPTLRS